MTLGLLVASENANKHTDRQDSCFISIDVDQVWINVLVEAAAVCFSLVLLFRFRSVS